MKLCKDCSNCHFIDHNMSECNSTQNVSVSLVTGKNVAIKYRFCSAARSGISDCGPDAKWFEPIHPANESAQDAIQREYDAATADARSEMRKYAFGDAKKSTSF